MSYRIPLTFVLLATLAVGCGDDDALPLDAGMSDAGFDDAGSEDAGFADAGQDAGRDSGMLPEDAGTTDAGLDAGMLPGDAGSTDAGDTDAGDTDAGCTSSEQCQNGDLCDGEEQCVDGACVPAAAPLVCDDLMDCTVDTCDAATGCVHTPIDADGDGDDACTDCDDSDPDRNSTAVELCNGVDDNCDGGIDEGLTGTFYPDCDGDGWAEEFAPSRTGCVVPTPASTGCTTPAPAWTSREPQFDDYDCADADDRAHSGVTGFFTTPVVDGIVEYDFDCDFTETLEIDVTGSCADAGSGCAATPGWDTSVPSCGESALFITSCTAACEPVTETRTQGCR